MPDRDVLSDHFEPLPLPTRWEGSDGEDSWWVEIECDRFSEGAPIVVSIWIEGETKDGTSFDGLATATPEQARGMAAALTLYADSAERQNSGSTDETSVAGSGAAVEITGRSWDAKAAGRRAVEKHGDALKRLSDEQGASDA